MILNKIKFNDFALYSGSQEVVLTPSSKSKPVTIIGGLNGAGKTSLLEGVQIALFGENAPFLQASKRNYSAYLKSAIHSGKKTAQQAGLKLEFELQGRHGAEIYLVDREWKLVGKNKVEEILKVFVNGDEDKTLTEVWSEYVENILPPRIAPLFFFDGEQVERYAKPEATTQVLEVGLNALLGLDLIEQTHRDVATLRNQQRKQIKEEVSSKLVEETMSMLQDLESEKAKFIQESGSLKNKLFQANKVLAKIETDLQLKGGDLFEQREAIRKKHDELGSDLDQTRAELRELASGDLPLALICPLLEQVQGQGDRETSARESKALLSILADRDACLLQLLNEISEESVKIAKKYFQDDSLKRKQEVKDVDTYLNMSRSSLYDLDTLLSKGLPKARERLASVRQRLEGIKDGMVQSSRQMGMIPDEEAVSDLIFKRKSAQDEIAELEKLIQRNAEKVASFEFNLTRAQSRFDKLLREQLAKDIDELEANRIVEFSSVVQDCLKGFKHRLAAKYIAAIESNIYECFTLLCRKEAFLDSVQINPITLKLRLSRSDGRQVHPEKLSAGERQLLVISILWGLAKAAGKPIPFIIDTPLGRLDSDHREKLINNFFSSAGHQVVLLSTDEEIDSHWKGELAPVISHSYLLEYDHINRATSINKGYFGEAV